MKIEDFVSKVKSAKKSQVATANFGIKLRVNKDRTEQHIFFSDIRTCRCCGHQIGGENNELKVLFYNPESLSIFQAGLLYSLFILNKVPYDYAGYHNCIAGKEFIENIKEAESL